MDIIFGVEVIFLGRCLTFGGWLYFIGRVGLYSTWLLVGVCLIFGKLIFERWGLYSVGVLYSLGSYNPGNGNIFYGYIWGGLYSKRGGLYWRGIYCRGL